MHIFFCRRKYFQAKVEFQVGNLYFNRKSTAAFEKMWTNIGKISQIPVDKTIFHDIII